MAKEKEDKPIKASAVPVDDGLIEVKKDGDVLRVHPTALNEHLKLGWSL